MDTTRRTKIVATIGPATHSAGMIEQLAHAGMDVARLNASHGSQVDHARSIAMLREAENKMHRPITIFLDLQGPKVRVGPLDGGQLELIPGQTVAITAGESGPGLIPVDYAQIVEEIRPGMQVLLADGAMELAVESVTTGRAVCRVVEGGTLLPRKGVNLPGLRLQLPSLTDKDRADALFALEQGVDYLSLSFVRSAEDVQVLRDLVKARGAATPIIAKIEKPQAVEHLEAIVDAADSIMVARGDLGVEMSPEKVPMIQKRIIELCNRAGKPVITATQMLESMINEPRPTRAEASDVANAIIDGTDAIMLSGETAVGKFPLRAVQMMDRIAREVEGKATFRAYPPGGGTVEHAISEAVGALVNTLRPAAVLLWEAGGRLARLIASERLGTPVVAVTTDPREYHAMNLIWGVRPVLHTGEDVPDVVSALGMHGRCVIVGRTAAEVSIRVWNGT